MDPKDIVIEQVTAFSDEIAEATRSLVKQLGNNYQSLTDDAVKEIVASSTVYLFIAKHLPTDEVAGMITIAIYRIPYTKKAYLDDLVIDEKFRKMGIATKLMQKAVEEAKKHQAAYIDFTSRPERVAGNNLYEKLGFQKREANVYRMRLDHEKV